MHFPCTRTFLFISFVVFLLFYFFFATFHQADYLPQLPPLPENLPQNALLEGSFSLHCKRPGNPTTTVRYIVPLDKKTGKPLSTASNIIFYAPFNGEASSIKSKGFPIWVRDFADKYGFTIFTLTIEAKAGMAQEKRKYYVYKAAGWYELFFDIKRHLEKSYALDEKKLLIVGESSGGSLAEHLIAYYPDKICAAAWNGGTLYAPLTPEARNIRILALHTDGCYGIVATSELERQCIEKGITLHCGCIKPDNLLADTANSNHAATPLAYELIRLFIASPNEFEQLWTAHPEIHGLPIGE